MSRNSIELFHECRRCFYDAHRRGHWRPKTPDYVINMAFDEIFKERLDRFRALGKPDPLMASVGIPGVPFDHEELEAWRDRYRGLRYVDPRTNFEIMGALDDVWDTQGQGLCVLDEKAGTDKQHKPLLEGDFGDCYQRQMDIYAYILERRGFPVHPNAYFVRARLVYFTTAKADRAFLCAHPDRLDVTFKLSVESCTVSIGWIENTLVEIKECLMSDKPPRPGRTCKYCRFRSRLRS